MEKKEEAYNKEDAEIFMDPYKYAVEVHIKNIKKKENTPEVKQEYIQGLETILVRQDISTAASIFPMIESCVDLIDTKDVEEDICVMLGHISQNVYAVAKELIRCKIFSKCISLYKRKPQTIKKILFLFTVIKNTVSDLPAILETELSEEEAATLQSIEKEEAHLNEQAKKRLSAFLEIIQKKTPKSK